VPPGNAICALDAALPSPPKPAVPLPAAVEITPSDPILRTRWLFVSVTYTTPPAAVLTPSGVFINAFCAAAPSPEYRVVPLPATVLIPPDEFTMRIRALYRSTK